MKNKTKSVFVYVSSVERGGDVTLYDTLSEAVNAALDEAKSEYKKPADWPEELIESVAEAAQGRHEEAADLLDEHYEANGVDDEFILITRAALPGHSLDDEGIPQAAE